MSARSRARRNKRRHIVPVWDLQVARYNHAWTVWVKKAKGMKGLYPVMINPRANGRIYRMRSMIEALGKGPFPVRGLDGGIMRGAMAHPGRVDKDGNLNVTIRVSSSFDNPELIDFMRKHPPVNPNPPKGPSNEWLEKLLEDSLNQESCFSIRATCDENKQLKEIQGWNVVNNDITAIEEHVKLLHMEMMVPPEMLEVNPSMLGRQRGEFGGLCAPAPARSESEVVKMDEKTHYSNYPHQHIPIAPIDYASLLSPQRQAESKTPQSIIDFLHGIRRPVDPRELIEITVPFEAKSIGGQINEFAKKLLAKTNAVEGECEEVGPYTRPLLPEALTEPTFRERYNYWKENSLTVNDLLALCQALLTNASPMNPFLMSSHIVVLEIPEDAIEIKDNGRWLPNSAYFGSEIDEWVLDRTSFEHCLAITSINEIDHAERILKNKGFIKLTVQRPIFNEAYDPRINYLDATRIKKHAFVVTLNTHEAIYYKGVLGKGILANLLMSEEQ